MTCWLCLCQCTIQYTSVSCQNATEAMLLVMEWQSVMRRPSATFSRENFDKHPWEMESCELLPFCKIQILLISYIPELCICRQQKNDRVARSKTWSAGENITVQGSGKAALLADVAVVRLSSWCSLRYFRADLQILTIHLSLCATYFIALQVAKQSMYGCDS